MYFVFHHCFAAARKCIMQISITINFYAIVMKRFDSKTLHVIPVQEQYNLAAFMLKAETD